MNEKESILELRKRQESFFSDFSTLLKKPIKQENEVVQKTRYFAEVLKWKLRTLVHQVAKYYFWPDEWGDAESMLSVYVEVPLIRFVEQQSKPWLRDKLTIAIMGHYSHGKTSVLNCLFDQKFPVQGTESTALATYLSFGKNTNIINLVDKGGGIQEILDNKSEVGLFDYKVSNNFPFARFFDYIEKECDNPLLQNLTFIDTPGLFSEKTGHSNPTLNVLYQADIILWCERLDGGFDETSLEFLRNNVVPQNTPVFLIGTFAEEVRDVNDVLVHFVNKAKDNGIKFSGSFVYGDPDSFHDSFKKSFNKIASSWASKYETHEPMVQILILVRSMIELLKGAQKQIKEDLTQLNSKCDELGNNIRRIFSRYNNAASSFKTSYYNLMETFEDRCVGAWGCGGAEGAMRSRIESTRTSWNSVDEAYRNINFKDILQIGHFGTQIVKVENDEKAVDELLQQFNDIYKVLTN